ncbi:MAG: hypothetical protein ACRCXL_00675 [Dermatophilaceae bacterium]
MREPAPTHDEAAGVEHFLHYVSSMLARADFLIPLAAAQRQFREDNYQMASAAQLEDLFYDALGMYLRENHPRVELRRRSGNELWDYGVGAADLSHKESQSPDFAVWWTGGNQEDGAWAPKRAAWRYEHTIVFVYTGVTGTLGWRLDPVGDDAALLAGLTGTLSGSLGINAIRRRTQRKGREALVLMAPLGPARMRVEHVWPAGTWEHLSFHDMWPDLGGPRLASRDLWLDKQPSRGGSGLGQVAVQAAGSVLTLTAEPMLPGIYVFPRRDLQDIPLVANNRAHSAAPDFVLALMDDARRHGRFVPMPLWFASFADSEPPNVYSRQRTQFEALFAPRSRPGSPTPRPGAPPRRPGRSGH